VDPGSSFEQFYLSEARVVFESVYLTCRNRAAAEDATQEAFARAFERWDRLRDQTWVGGWVMTTALNVARRSLRSRGGGPLPRESPNPEEGVDLWSVVSRLPRRQQEAVVLYYRIDLPVAEIAQILRCSEGTVRTHLARARPALRSLLEGGSGGD
jgi:DNA-directed RNA polymerase specialized sigma24 family protein